MSLLKKLGIGTGVVVVGLGIAGRVADPYDQLVDTNTLVDGMRAEAQRYDMGGLTIDANPGDDSTCLADYSLTTRDGSIVTITVPRVGDAELRNATFSKDLTCVGDARYHLRQGVDAVRNVGYGSCEGINDGNACGTTFLGNLTGFFQGMGRGLERMYDTVLGRTTDISQRLGKGYKAATE